MPKNFYKALAVLVGYIIGVGMFGLPFLASRSGIGTVVFFVITLGLVQHFLHLIYANVILVTKEYHQLPGYAGLYLGPAGKRVSGAAKVVGDFGALLAYIIITGIFLHHLLSPYFGGSEFMYASTLFALQAIVVFFGLGVLARVELVMSALLILIVGLLAMKGLGLVELGNYQAIDWRYLLLPYGATLFALDGNGAIPIIVRLLRRHQAGVRNVIRLGFIIPVTIIIVFTFVVVGISGAATTPDALTGLRSSFENGVVTLALVFGILTMITSFLGVSESSLEMLCRDFRLPARWGWALVAFVPYGMYALGFKNLIDVISFAGAVAGGLSAIILIMIFMKLEKKKGKIVIFRHPPKRAVAFVLIFLFLCGIIYEILHFTRL